MRCATLKYMNRPMDGVAPRFLIRDRDEKFGPCSTA